MNYYVVLTDWRNSGMLVHVVENEALIFCYPGMWLPFNFAPYIQSGIEEVDEEYREVSRDEAFELIKTLHFPDGKDWYDWSLEQ